MPRCGLLVTMLLAAVPILAEPVYQVTFRVVTAFGQPVEATLSSVGDAIHHTDVTAKCHGLECSDLTEGPYGYVVTLGGSGRKVEGTTVVYRKNQVVVVDVGAPEGEVDDASFVTVAGRVTNAASAGPLWVRLQALFSDVSVSTAVSADGRFEIQNVRPGKWMLLVLHNSDVVFHEPYTCESTNPKPIQIVLPRSAAGK
jgi:hypothetical protein